MRDKIPWDFEIQTDHLIPVKRPDLMIDNKKKKKKRKLWTYQIMDFAVLADHRGEIKENEKRYKYLAFAKGVKSNGTGKRRWHQL